MGVNATLQNTINRFSGDPLIGFDPIAVDDVVGSDTYAGAIMALDIAQAACSGFADCPIPAMASLSNDAAALWGVINTPADVKANISALQSVLSQSADVLGFGTVPPPVMTPAVVAKKPPVTRAPLSLVTQSKINKGTSILGLGLPNWAVYGSGAALVLGIGYMIFKRKAA